MDIMSQHMYISEQEEYRRCTIQRLKKFGKL